MQVLDTRNTVAKSNLKEFSLIMYFEIIFTRYLWTMKTIWLSKYCAMRKFKNLAHLQIKVILTQMWSKLCEIQTMTDLGIEYARLFKLSFDMESSIIFLIGTYRFSFNCGSIIEKSYFNSNCKVFHKEIRPPSKHISSGRGRLQFNPKFILGLAFFLFWDKIGKKYWQSRTTDAQWSLFSLKSRTFGIGHTNCGVLGVFLVKLSAPILVQWVPCPCFPCYSTIISTKTQPLYPLPK